ncbi:hypothetical protein ACWD4L_43945 [Streptomyces sp. NPDC002596]
MGVSGCWIVLLRLPYLAVSSVFAFMRLLPMSDVDKDIEAHRRDRLGGVIHEYAHAG